MPISYSGRTYAEGKKIRWTDGVAAFWHIVKFNLLSTKAPHYNNSESESRKLEDRAPETQPVTEAERSLVRQ